MFIGIGLNLHTRKYGGGTPTPTPTPTPIPTPAITKTSASGDVLSFSIDGAGYLIGYYIRLQLAGASNFTTNYPGEGALRDDYRILTIEDFTDDDLNGTVEMNALSGLVGQNAGLAYLRICYGQEALDGLSIDWGTWSNVISDTVVLLSPSTLDAASKNMFIDLSGGDLTASTQIVGVGAETGARSTQLRSGKGYFEVKINSFSQGDRILVGVCNTSYTPSGYGKVGVNGAQIRADGPVYDGTGGFVSSPYSGIANNDIIGIHYDTGAGKFWPSKNATQYGSPAAGTGGFDLPAGMTSLYALIQLIPVGSGPSNSATINFGATAFGGVGPASGFSAMV